MGIRKHFADFKLSADSDKIDTVIGSSVTVDGPIVSKKDIRVDGKVNGSVSTKGSLFVGPEGVIGGDIKARHVTICGKVTGNVTSSGRVIISSKAFITGDLSMEHLVVDEGAIFNGKANMQTGTLHKGTDSVSDNSLIAEQ
jgi:cytoskeletal protein CcmA (bactofilin family)